jgi:transcriptional regulator with XRE-family HTH domain
VYNSSENKKLLMGEQIMLLSEHLRQIRERKGWTQNHLAEVSGVPQPSIWRLEKGLILNPKTSLLRKLAEALGVTMDYLLREEEKPSFDEILREDEVGQAIFRGYEELDDQGRGQLKSFTDWLNEQSKKKRDAGNE